MESHITVRTWLIYRKYSHFWGFVWISCGIDVNAVMKSRNVCWEREIIASILWITAKPCPCFLAACPRPLRSQRGWPRAHRGPVEGAHLQGSDGVWDGPQLPRWGRGRGTGSCPHPWPRPPGGHQCGCRRGPGPAPPQPQIGLPSTLLAVPPPQACLPATSLVCARLTRRVPRPGCWCPHTRERTLEAASDSSFCHVVGKATFDLCWPRAGCADQYSSVVAVLTLVNLYSCVCVCASSFWSNCHRFPVVTGDKTGYCRFLLQGSAQSWNCCAVIWHLW